MEARYNYELIKDYLDGLLDSKTAGEMRSLIKNDETTKSIAIGILMLDKKFKNNEQALNNYLEELLKTQQDVIETHISAKKSFSWIKIASAILLLAIVGLASYEYLQPDIIELVGQEISTPYQNESIFRNSDSNNKNGFLAYRKGDYAKASKLLSDSQNAESIFFNSLSQLYQGNHGQAIILLSNPELQTTRYAEQSTWYLGLAYLRANKMDSAKILLVEITSSHNHFKKRKAIELLKAID